MMTIYFEGALVSFLRFLQSVLDEVRGTEDKDVI